MLRALTFSGCDRDAGVAAQSLLAPLAFGPLFIPAGEDVEARLVLAPAPAAAQVRKAHGRQFGATTLTRIHSLILPTHHAVQGDPLASSPVLSRAEAAQAAVTAGLSHTIWVRALTSGRVQSPGCGKVPLIWD